MANNSIEGNFQGLEPLRKKLKAVSEDVQLKGGRFALRKAGQVLEAEAVSEMQRLDRESTPEAIHRNVALRFSTKRFRRTGDIAFRLGVLGGAASKTSNESNPGGDTWYWRLLEFGSQNTPARRPLTNAIKRKQGDIINTFRTEYMKALDRAIRRARK